MADAHDLDDEPVVEYLVDDAVVADAYPVSAGFAGHRHASWWTGIVSEKVDGRPDPLLLAAG